MNEIKKNLKKKNEAVEQSHYKEAAAACKAIGSEYLNQEKYEEALVEHLEELKYCELIGDQLGVAVANRRIGECYTYLYNFEKALLHIRQFYDIAVSLKSVIEEQRAWATFGRAYYLKYQYDCGFGYNRCEILDEAERAYNEALQIMHALDPEIKSIELAEMKCRLLLNLGLVIEARGDQSESSKLFKEGFEIAVENGLQEDIYRCGYAFGTSHQKSGKHDLADIVFSKTFAAAKMLNNINLICEVLLAKSISLICLKEYSEAKQCLKSAYKLHSTNIENVQKITKALKVCIRILNYENKLSVCKSLSVRKLMLEKVADDLSSIGCYTLAIEKYHLVLNCMKQDCSPDSELAPIYYSLAQTHLDKGSISKALKYFKKEYNCNKKAPLEQVETLWKMTEILDKEKEVNKSKEQEKQLLLAVYLSEQAGDQRYIYSSLNKLLAFYNSININNVNLVEDIKKKIDAINYKCESEGEIEDEENQDSFSDINLSELSDSDNEEIITHRKQRKKIETKVNEKGETPLHQACIEGNFCKVKRLVVNGHSVNVRDYAGWTPLHEACNYGWYNIVEFLLQNGADINDPGGPECKGITPLHDAASCGNLDVIQLLISKGASVIVKNENGEIPLDSLLQWKGDACDLDDVTLKQYKAIQDELLTKMAEAGLSRNDIFLDNLKVSDSCNEQSEHVHIEEKCNMFPILSSDDDSCDYEIDSTLSYLSVNNKQNWNKAEDRSVMENLQQKSADVVPVKSQIPKINDGPFINESKVKKWLIKDTDKVPKFKGKRKLNARTCKCIDKYLTVLDFPEKERKRIFLDQASNTCMTLTKSDKFIESNPLQQSFSLKSENTKFCLRVNIAGKLIFVPVPEDTCIISWLMEETAKRYQCLDGSKPHLTLTKNNALLSGSDLIKDIFINNEEVLSLVERWDEPSLEERYFHLCKKHNLVVSSSVKKRLQCFQQSSEINFSNCNIPYSHLNVIFRTIFNCKILQHLNFSGTPLTYTMMKEFVVCLPNFIELSVLNLSCCGLSSQSIKEVHDFVNDQISKNDILPSLKILDLSYNFFSPCPNFVSFFKLHSLASLNLSSCFLDSTFFSRMLLKAVKEKENLEELNISGNIFGGEELSNFLHHLPKKRLKKLSLSNTLKNEVGLGSKLHSCLDRTLSCLFELKLQGCFLNNKDLNQIAASFSYITNLRVLDVSSNPLLSSYCIYSFIKKANESNLNITDLNITGTCVWDDRYFCNPADFLKLKTLKHLCFDNCLDDLTEELMQLWIEKWGSRAICTNILFCELSVKEN